MTTDQAKEYTYSEIFHSIQGEGHYTGVPTAWIRFFLCNLQCNGFGQTDPTNPETYDLPFKDFDLSDIKRVEDLPVWEKGCDSSYTWSKKYRHLMSKASGDVIAGRLIDIMKNDSNPEGLFKHPLSKQTGHLCITGGEPLMKHAQQGIPEIYESLLERDNIPSSITFETNGTQKLTEDFIDYWSTLQKGRFPYGVNRCPELFFSCSPKLWSVAGEQAKRAIKPEFVAEYHKLSSKGQLKFVLGNVQEQWDEMDSVVKQFRELGIDWPVWVMPVGAREEEQQSSAGEVAEMAFKRGYNVAARVHVYLFGNAIGT